jgi:hypothetical protein
MIAEYDARKVSGTLLVAAALALATLISVQADAQVVGATLSGTITDP